MDYEEKLREIINSNSEYYPSEDKAVFAKYFPELKENEDGEIIKWIIDGIRYNMDNETLETSEYKKQAKKAITWLEKQVDKDKLICELGEYKVKYTQKVLQEDLNKNTESQSQPKFKVGNWIANGGANPCYVKSIFGDYYELCSCEGFEYTKPIKDVDYIYHLWSINDAKNGDVLVGKDVRPFIFTGEFDVQDDNPIAYCGINSDDEFITGKGSHWTFKDGIKPATKEQRDLLFQKMKEAGYEWDSEKKEVKKIDVKKIYTIDR